MAKISEPPLVLFQNLLLETAAEASFKARVQGVPPEHVEQHQNQNHQQGEHQQEEDEQAVSEGVVWNETHIVRQVQELEVVSRW